MWFRRRKAGEPVVIVSGLPRSGTSMLMKMLEAGGLQIMTDGGRSADVDNPKGYFEHERIKDLEKETDKSYLREGRGKALKMIQRLGSADAAADREAMKEAYRNDIVRTRLLCRKRSNFEMIEIQYKATVEDPAEAARRVNEFLGGRLDEAGMRQAVDESLYRNRAG